MAQWTRDEYLISTDPKHLELDVIHGYLVRSYWAAGVKREVVAASLRGSINFGLYRAGQQVGFARVVSDQATFAWLADVFVLEPERGRGLGKFLVACAKGHPKLQGLRRWMLGTADAHGLYGQFGFAALAQPARFMEVRVSPPQATDPC